MVGIPTWIVAGGAIVSAVATGFIALYAIVNHRLANAIKSSNEQHQQETRDLLKSLSQAIYYLSHSEGRNEAMKKIKEQEGKAGRNFITQGKA